jgi:hypothetical protein
MTKIRAQLNIEIAIDIEIFTALIRALSNEFQ